MNILALDTSMGACSAAVLRADGNARRLEALQVEMPRGHAEALMPMVDEVLAEADIEARDLDLIAATRGPGSFTGVRIAIAAARGLALVTHGKLFGTDSLSVMARASLDAGAEPNGPFAVAVDARRGMIYFGLYDESARRLDGPLLISPDDAAGRLADGTCAAVGSGAALLAKATATQGRTLDVTLDSLQPSAAALAQIAFESGETCEVLRPLYLRPPDAKPQAPALERC
jgi:tRNA threonylcarbamoyladenosine biosynthesis protein TsaB